MRSRHTRRAAPAAGRRTCRTAAALALCACLVLAACARENFSDEAGDSAPPAPMPAAEPARFSPDTPGAPGMDDPLAGTWWALAPSRPYMGLRLVLVGTSTPSELTGSWILFDWRATTQPESLVRRSRPVELHALRDGQPSAPTSLTVTGPSPMLDENGLPNGQRGTWRLELRPNNLPGEELRFFGRAIHSELTGPEGIDVELVRAFRPWKT